MLRVRRVLLPVLLAEEVRARNVAAQPLHEQLLYAPVVLRDNIAVPALALGKYPVRLHHQLRRLALRGGDMFKNISVEFTAHLDITPFYIAFLLKRQYSSKSSSFFSKPDALHTRS